LSGRAGTAPVRRRRRERARSRPMRGRGARCWCADSALLSAPPRLSHRENRRARQLARVLHCITSNVESQRPVLFLVFVALVCLGGRSRARGDRGAGSRRVGAAAALLAGVREQERYSRRQARRPVSSARPSATALALCDASCVASSRRVWSRKRYQRCSRRGCRPDDRSTQGPRSAERASPHCVCGGQPCACRRRCRSAK